MRSNFGKYVSSFVTNKVCVCVNDSELVAKGEYVYTWLFYSVFRTNSKIRCNFHC